VSYSIETRYEEDEARIRVVPEHGKAITFVVDRRRAPVTRSLACETRYVVGLRGSGGNGFSTHTSYEAACRSALSRATRYGKAYAKARGVAR
jgi:hypothetical protein